MVQDLVGRVVQVRCHIDRKCTRGHRPEVLVRIGMDLLCMDLVVFHLDRLDHVKGHLICKDHPVDPRWVVLGHKVLHLM